MENKTIEQIYEEHMYKEPKRYSKFFKNINLGIETEAYSRWKIEKENLELVKTIPQEIRNKILAYLKKGNSVGEIARHFKVNGMAVFYLINYNIESALYLKEISR